MYDHFSSSNVLTPLSSSTVTVYCFVLRGVRGYRPKLTRVTTHIWKQMGQNVHYFILFLQNIKTERNSERSCRIHCGYICVTSFGCYLTPLCVDIVCSPSLFSVVVFLCSFVFFFSSLCSPSFFFFLTHQNEHQRLVFCGFLFSAARFITPGTGTDSAKVPGLS